MTPEGEVKQSVRNALNDVGAYGHAPVQNGMGKPALDFHVNHRGFYAGVETKAPGGKPTVRQQRTMREIHKAGGALFLIDSASSTDFAQFLGWLLHPTPGFVSLNARKYLNEPRDG